MTDLDLLRLHVAVLFTQDDTGRLLRINDVGGKPAPQFYYGPSREGSVWRFRYDMPLGAITELERLAADEPPQPELRCTREFIERCRAILAREHPVEEVYSGSAYYFPNSFLDPSGVVPVTPENAAALAGAFSWLPNEIGWLQPCFAVIQNGAAVSLCFSARSTEQAAEAGVETAPDFGGRGYATRVTAAWAAAVRQQGRIPLYSTSWENAASQGVARRLGLVQYASDLHFT